MKTCPDCQGKFENIGRHWNASDQCDYPSFTKSQKEIIVGLLMGDGTLGNHHKPYNSYLRVKMINQEYLNYLHDEFGILSSPVSLSRTAFEGAQENVRRGFQNDAKPSQYNDLYDWRTISHPTLNQFDAWYDSGTKEWPHDIYLTPLTLKHYFVGDGSMRKSQQTIRISMSNERKHQEKVANLFSKAGLPHPHRWNEQENQHGNMKCDACWNVEESKRLFEYMGQPLPGFREKWPSDFTN